MAFRVSLLAVFPSCEAASSGGACPSDGGACSPAPSSRSAGAVMMGDTMVGAFLSTAFAHNELLAEHLVGCVVPTSCFDSFLVSVLVVKSWAGIFKCAFETTEVL